MPRRSNRTPDKPRDFYEEALSQAERVRLSQAKQIQGLDEEIALLRVRLRGTSLSFQGLYWILPISDGSSHLLGSGPLLMVGLMTLMSSLAITALILRQRFNGRRRV